MSYLLPSEVFCPAGLDIVSLPPWRQESPLGRSRRYNVPMPIANPRQQPGSRARRSVLTLEATGVLIIAILILILTLARYWHHIPWGAR